MLADTPMLAAVASPRRREILRLVWSDELAAGAIHRAMPDVTFGAVSLQLRALVNAGLVESRAEGRHRLYRARRDALGPVARMLEGHVERRALAAQASGGTARDAPRPRRRNARADGRRQPERESDPS